MEVFNMARKKIDHNPEVVLQKAILKAAGLWGVNNTELARIIGVSEPTVSRLYADTSKGIKPDSKEGELSLLFIRAFRALDAFLGNALENEKKWLRAKNKVLNGIPLELMKTVTGLVSVVNYLDAVRGKI